MDGDEEKKKRHAHARKRITIGIVTTVCIALLFVIWVLRGDEIKKACGGDDGACAVELSKEALSGKSVEFEQVADTF